MPGCGIGVTDAVTSQIGNRRADRFLRSLRMQLEGLTRQLAVEDQRRAGHSDRAKNEVDDGGRLFQKLSRMAEN